MILSTMPLKDGATLWFIPDDPPHSSGEHSIGVVSPKGFCPLSCLTVVYMMGIVLHEGIIGSAVSV